jgi:dTDP-4-amino-4,6-dideoxygalactose transaminase
MLAIEGGTPVRTREFPRRAPFGEREVELVTEAIRSQNLFRGRLVQQFEEGFGALYGARHAVASTSGTAAIHVAIGTLNPEPGDEIITAPITDGGSVVPILYQGCIPIFADVDDTYNMAPRAVEANITPRTKAILLVHLFGNPCDVDAMVAIARKHGIPLIEDCSQAHATEYKGRPLGSFGDIACFSLQQSKHMTTGDGGMTITSREDLQRRMRLFRDKGWTTEPGWGRKCYEFLAPNYRMTELQAAVGLAQLERVKAVVERRHALGTLLTEKIQGLPGVVPAPVTPGGKHTYWAYSFAVTEGTSDEFAAALKAEGIPAGARYTVEPIYLCMDALAAKKTFGTSGYPFDGSHGGRKIDYVKGLCPRAEQALDQMVGMTIHENFTEEDILDIAAAVRKVAEGLAAKRATG